MKFFLQLLLIIGLISCSDKVVDYELDSGTYEGEFMIRHEDGREEKGEIKLIIEGNEYEIISELMYLPPGGAGAIGIKKEKVTFRDTIPHTTEFDFSLIINGEYSLDKNVKGIILRQYDKERKRYRVMKLERTR